jgi:hypothetical protein
MDRLRIAISDPRVAWTYVREGREGVVRLKLSQLLYIQSIKLKKIFSETNEFDECVKHKLLLSDMKYIPPVNFSKALYVICRIGKPEVVLETGVASGMSTAYMLKVLEKNEQGELYSIDMPNYEENLVRKVHGYLPEPISILPEGKSVDWLVPNNLKHRWHLKIGLTKDLVPSICKTLGKISMFLHDSEHTYENMYFEYNTAWAHLENGGYLLSDDTWWNTAFSDFCHEVGVRPTYVYSTGVAGVRKPR